MLLNTDGRKQLDVRGLRVYFYCFVDVGLCCTESLNLLLSLARWLWVTRLYLIPYQLNVSLSNLPPLSLLFSNNQVIKNVLDHLAETLLRQVLQIGDPSSWSPTPAILHVSKILSHWQFNMDTHFNVGSLSHSQNISPLTNIDKSVPELGAPCAYGYLLDIIVYRVNVPLSVDELLWLQTMMF